MINFSIHNVTEVQKTRVNKSDYDEGGWIVLTMGAQNFSWNTEEQETISNEVTFFFKDLELGLAQLRTVIDKGIASFRIEEATAAMAKVKEDAEKELKELEANG
tara:strand:+ start:336 stop:647 length:312 start_codon:yes stop_codon:yes gene_type:complete